MANKKTNLDNDPNHRIKIAFKKLLEAKNSQEPKTLRISFNKQAKTVKSIVTLCEDWMEAESCQKGAASISDDDMYQKYKSQSHRAYKKFCTAAKKIAKVKVTPSSPENFKTLSKAIDHLGDDYSEKSLWQNLRPVVRALKR